MVFLGADPPGLDAQRGAKNGDVHLRGGRASRLRSALVAQKWTAALLIGLAAAAHQGFSANIFTLTSDMFRKSAVGSVVGLAGFCGGVGGILMNYGSGWIKQVTGSYLIMFCIAGTVYLLAVICLHLLAPRLTPVKLSSDQ